MCKNAGGVKMQQKLVKNYKMQAAEWRNFKEKKDLKEIRK